MKVNLGAPELSSSVANAHEFCLKLGLPQFKVCEATMKFLRTFDHLFDILNSRNPLTKNCKAAMTLRNQHFWRSFLSNTRIYISSLKAESGTLWHSPTERPHSLASWLLLTVLLLFEELVVGSPDHPPCLKYLLTYKLSQDHLELFFGCIRCHLGCNNNPTCRQFVAVYKRLLVQNEIKASNANCGNLELVPILTVESSTIQRITNNTDDVEITICQTLQQNISEKQPLAVTASKHVLRNLDCSYISEKQPLAVNASKHVLHNLDCSYISE